MIGVVNNFCCCAFRFCNVPLREGARIVDVLEDQTRILPRHGGFRTENYGFLDALNDGVKPFAAIRVLGRAAFGQTNRDSRTEASPRQFKRTPPQDVRGACLTSLSRRVDNNESPCLPTWETSPSC